MVIPFWRSRRSSSTLVLAMGKVIRIAQSTHSPSLRLTEAAPKTLICRRTKGAE